MIRLTAKQQKQLARKIRTCKNKLFPERGGGKKLAALLDISPQLLTNWMAGTRLPLGAPIGEIGTNIRYFHSGIMFTSILKTQIQSLRSGHFSNEIP